MDFKSQGSKGKQALAKLETIYFPGIFSAHTI